MLIVVTIATVFGFAACNKNGNDETIDGAPKNIRVVAPDGTPALALFGFFNGNDIFGSYKLNSESRFCTSETTLLFSTTIPITPILFIFPPK